MSDAPKCEPPEELRGVGGWHWLATDTHGPVLCRWSEHRGVAGDWRWHYAGSRDGDISTAAIEVCGWRYVGPALTPAEAATLRTERDAAVAEVARLREALKYIRAYPNAIAAQTNADAALTPKDKS